jgi:hypothetical protein
MTSEPVNAGSYDVSPVDGSVAHVVGNQLLLINADGSGRRLLVDGGRDPIFSPDGKTIAYSRNGLNLYDLPTGIPNLVLEDYPLGSSFPPETYSPDGTKLLIKIGHPPDSPWTALQEISTARLYNLSGLRLMA